MPWLNIRTIVLESEADEEYRAAAGQFARFADAWEGVEWLLARNARPPGSFFSLETDDGDEFYIFPVKGDPDADIPDMYIFYQYNDDEVVIHGINAVEATAQEPEDEA